MSNPPPLRAFQGVGIELEYALVGRTDLACKPIADLVLNHLSGGDPNQAERGALGWSNEMFMHVIEIKNLRPTASLEHLAAALQAELRSVEPVLEALDVQLMPSAMHPSMNPAVEARLWPHANRDIYRCYEHIFECRTHGWANLQSMHINLPFGDDAEFARLHAAIRLVLPILPALAASSPIADRRDTGFADYRLEVYRTNADILPSIGGQVIPETVSSRAEYQERILDPMYRDIRPFDPQGILRHEWLNSRGAIARFDRNAIEIRVLDTQECPQADLAIAAAAISVIRFLYQAESGPLVAQQAIGTGRLANLLTACIRDAERTVIDDADYLALLGYPGRRCEAQQLWRFLIERMLARASESVWNQPLQTILQHGPLARRIQRALDMPGEYSNAKINTVYNQLCHCLREGRMFTGKP